MLYSEPLQVISKLLSLWKELWPQILKGLRYPLGFHGPHFENCWFDPEGLWYQELKPSILSIPGSPRKHCWWHISLPRRNSLVEIWHAAPLSFPLPQAIFHWSLPSEPCSVVPAGQHSISGLISPESSRMIPPVPNLTFVNNQNLRSTVESSLENERKGGNYNLIILTITVRLWPRVTTNNVISFWITSDENPQAFVLLVLSHVIPGPF